MVSAPKGPPSELGGSGGRLDVLIVDDDEDTCDAVASVLAEAGYVTKCVHDGLEALAHLRKGPIPAVILLDLMMPKMSGWTVFMEIRALPTCQLVPIVLMTGHGPQWGYPSPRVLRKPVGCHELVVTLRSAMAST